MKKLTEGRGKTLVSMSELSLTVNGHMAVSYDNPFFVDVGYLYEPLIIGKAFDEPDSPECMTLCTVKLLQPMYLSSRDGLTMSIDSRCELMELLTDKQLDSIVEGLYKEPTGCVHYAEPIRSKLCTSNNMRLPEDEAIKTALGHKLLKSYERS